MAKKSSKSSKKQTDVKKQYKALLRAELTASPEQLKVIEKKIADMRRNHKELTDPYNSFI
jgi:23S rRNA-/tRNA-specific pseudouridylate synthase